MRDLLRRLDKLEQQVTPTACECAKRPAWVRYANHFGELLPDTRPQPEPITCPVHGVVAADQRIVQYVSADPVNGGIAPGFKGYQQT